MELARALAIATIMMSLSVTKKRSKKIVSKMLSTLPYIREMMLNATASNKMIMVSLFSHFQRITVKILTVIEHISISLNLMGSSEFVKTPGCGPGENGLSA